MYNFGRLWHIARTKFNEFPVSHCLDVKSVQTDINCEGGWVGLGVLCSYACVVRNAAVIIFGNIMLQQKAVKWF
jgi:hypothetical protein